jgi:hypothetical protein
LPSPAPPDRLEAAYLRAAEQPTAEVINYLISLEGIHAGTAVVDALPDPLRWIWAMFLLDADVCNGGFNQYFYNSSGLWVDDAIAGYRAMGMPEYASIVDRAAATAVGPKESETRRRAREARTLEAFSETYQHTSLGAFDKEYYALGDYQATTDTYIRAHAEAFTHSRNRGRANGA